MSREDLAAAALYVPATLALAFVDHRVRRFPQHVVTEYVPSVIAGTSGAPAKYRVLMPFSLDWLTSSTGSDPYLLFLVVEFVAILSALIVFHWYLRQWYSPTASLGATLGVAALLPLTFTNSWAHPDTFPDLMLFTGGCAAIASGRDGLLMAVIIVGMFNRETIGFLALLWILDRLPVSRSPGVIARSVGLTALVAALYIGLRWARGFELYRLWMLRENLNVLTPLPPGFDPYTRIAGYFWLVLLAPLAGLAVVGARRPGAPRFFRSTLAIAGMFVIIAWLFAAVIEVRVFVPVLPLLAPAVVGAFVDVRRADQLTDSVSAAMAVRRD